MDCRTGKILNPKTCVYVKECRPGYVRNTKFMCRKTSQKRNRPKKSNRNRDSNKNRKKTGLTPYIRSKTFRANTRI